MVGRIVRALLMLMLTLMLIMMTLDVMMMVSLGAGFGSVEEFPLSRWLLARSW